MNTKTNPKTKHITTYKGFDSDLKCLGFQYEIGKEYTHSGKVEACAEGFHACEHPLDVFRYYAPAGNRFCVVEQSGELSRREGDTKVASRTIKINAETGIPGLVKAAIEYTTSRCDPIDPKSPASATGEQGAASATGWRVAASATGEQGAASATGKQGAAMACGRFGKAKGALGNALFLVFRNGDYEIMHAKALIVGRDGIKPDVFYALDEDGNAVEV